MDETTGPQAPERRRFTPYGTVNAEQAAQLKAGTGLDLEGYRRNLDNSAIRHVLKNHGDPAKEIARGNAPLHKADFEKLPELLAQPDASMYAGKNQYGQDLIASAKRVNGHWIIIEEAREAKQVLNLTTLYKKSARPLADDAAPEGTTPSLTPEAIQSTARRILQQVVGQRNVEGKPKASTTNDVPAAPAPTAAPDGLAVGDKIDVSGDGKPYTLKEDRGAKVVGCAEIADRIGVFHRLDHGETLPFGPAKIPTAFFKMSRWLVTLWSCARSRRTSACSSWALGTAAGSLPAAAAVGAVPTPANRRRHVRRLSVVMPRPWATRRAGTPLCHCATAARLNASS